MAKGAGDETFSERFTRLIDASGLEVGEVVRIVGWKSESSFYKAKRGDQRALNAVGLLRLAARLQVSPYYLVGEPEPFDNSRLTLPRSTRGAASLAIRVQPTPPETSPRSIDDRLRLLEEHAVDTIGVAEKVMTLAKAVAALAFGRELPGTIRDHLREVLEQSQEDRS